MQKRPFVLQAGYKLTLVVLKSSNKGKGPHEMYRKSRSVILVEILEQVF